MNNKKFRLWLLIDSFFVVLGCIFGPIGIYAIFTDFEDKISGLVLYIFCFIGLALVFLYRLAKNKLFMGSIEQLKIKDDTVNDFLDKTK